MTEKNGIYRERPSWSAWAECRKRYKLYAITISTSIVLAVIVYLLSPTVYASQIKMADEHKEMGLLVGQNRWEALLRQSTPMGGNDEGINNPEIYILLLKSRNFINSLTDIKVENYNTTLYQYIKTYHKKTINERISSLFTDEKNYVIDVLKENIKYKVHKRFSIVLIQYSDNDPIVSSQVVDSIRVRLQKEITRLRIMKVKANYENAKKARILAQNEYDKELSKYSTYAETHQSPISVEETTKLKLLSENAQQAFDRYRDACTNEKRSEFLMQRATPAFTIIKKTNVPLEHISPKFHVVIFVLCIIAFIFTTWWILYKKNKEIKKLQQSQQ